MSAFEGNGHRTSPEHRKINGASIPPHRFKKSLRQIPPQMGGCSEPEDNRKTSSSLLLVVASSNFVQSVSDDQHLEQIESGSGQMNFHDQKQLETLSEDFCSLLTIEKFSGTLDWQNALDFLVSNFPGSFGAILIQRRHEPNSALLWSGDIDPGAIASYSSHYAQVNPWVDVWKGLPNGSIRVSEYHSPANQFRGMEFYEDWIRPLKNAEASVGIKLCDSNDILLHIPIHFNLNQCELYDDALAYVLTRAKSDLMRGIQAEQLFSEAYRAGSLEQLCKSNRDPVFVIDSARKVYDCNSQARNLISETVVTTNMGKLSLNHGNANSWLETEVAYQRKSSQKREWRSVFRFGKFDKLFELFPVNISAVSSIFLYSQLFALRISEFPRHTTPDVELLSRHYRFTPSEKRLCELIVSGKSIQQTAEALGNTESTVRSTLKIIFDKTQTHRQGELIALCNRFPAAREV